MAALAAAVFALCAAAGSARPLDLGRISFLPSRFRVGEEVELRAELLAAANGGIEGGKLEAFSVGPSDLPAATSTACELRSLAIVKSGKSWELRIHFVPWTSGAGRLPSINIHNYEIPSIDYDTAASIRTSDRELDPPKGQRELAGTALYFYGTIGLAVLLGLLILGFVTCLVPGARELLRRWRAGAAYKELRTAADYLESIIGKIKPSAFYGALAGAFRLYLAARVLPEAPSLTPRELSALPEDKFPVPAIRDEAAAALLEADAVRFGGRQPDETSMHAAVRRVLSIASAAEEAINARL